LNTQMSTLQKSELKSIVAAERKKKIKKSIPYYILVAVPFAMLIVFRYQPMYGLQIAFRDYSPRLGFFGSPWVGLHYFRMFFDTPSAWPVIWNTISLNVYALIAGFPIPIILAICINEVRVKSFKKTAQMITYMPYFISTVVLVAIIHQFTDMQIGIVNIILGLFNVAPINFMGHLEYFRHIFVWTGIWQSMGFSAVIFIAALSGVSPELYDAAHVDGASKIQRIWHVDIPGILPTIVILFLLSAGQLLSIGFERVYLMQNTINIPHSEVISTFVYKVGVQNINFSLATAVGMFNSVINFILLVILNYTARKINQVAVW